MVEKPSYEELLQQVKELQKKVINSKQIESNMKESKERYRGIVAAFDGFIYICSQDYRIEFMNDRFIERTGYDATGDLCYKALHELDSVCSWCVNDRVFAGETVRWEIQSPKDDRWYYVVNTPIQYPDGRLSKQAVIIDITERKQLEEQLRKSHNEMEQRVIDRTAELEAANEALKKQIEEREEVERAHKESEEKYRQLFRTVTDVIMLFDAETRKFIDVNNAALMLYGYSREEFLNLRYQDITAEPEKSDASIRQTLAGKLTRIPTRYHKKKDGTVFPVEISVSTLELSNGMVLCGIVRDITEREQTQKLVQNLSQMLMQTQERERQMISYELHDRIAQNLSTLKINCDMLFDGQSDIPSELIEKTANLSVLIEQTIISVRNLAYDLRPPGLDQMGLVHALKIYCKEFFQNSGIRVDFQPAGIHKLNLNVDTEIHLYRLVQEGLNNIWKHADADLATIKLLGAYPDIILRIEDNGKGFDVKAREFAIDDEKRMGLRSMKERVSLLGGQMEIRSDPMQGTKIFIKLPFRE